MMGAPLEWQEFTDVICVNRRWGIGTNRGRLEAATDQELDCSERFRAILVTEFSAQRGRRAHGQPSLMWSRSTRPN